MINTTQGDLRSSHNNNDPLSERIRCTLVTTWGHGDSRPRHAQSFRDGTEHQLWHARPAGAWKETYVWFIFNFNASTQCEQNYVTLSNRGLSLRTGSTFSRASRDWDWRTFCSWFINLSRNIWDAVANRNMKLFKWFSRALWICNFCRLPCIHLSQFSQVARRRQSSLPAKDILPTLINAIA